MSKLILNLPLFLDPDTLAYVFDPDDSESNSELNVYDEIGTGPGGLDTALQYAHDGYIVVCTDQETQRLIDHEQDLVNDCFGRRVYEPVSETQEL